MKIFLVNPVRYSIYDIENQLHPLGLLYIASYLREHLNENIEFKYVNWNYEEEFLRFKPELVFMTTVTPYYNDAKNLAQQFKQLDSSVSIVVGGYHVTALPQTMTEHMDFGILGEGEKASLQFMQDYLKGTTKKLYSADLIEPLDSIPFPARDLVKHMIKSYDFTDIITARGCPFNCIFCASTRFWKKVRYHSAEYVVAEIRELAENYTRRLVFVDDLFAVNKKRLKKISTLLRQEGLDIEFNTSARADAFDEEVCKLLREMGCINLCFGFESQTSRVLRYLKRGGAVPEHNVRAVRLCNKHGIGVSASFIIGSRDETEKEILQTLDFAKMKGHRYVIGNVLSPLPGTPLWDEALERGLVSNDMDWDALNFCLHNPSTHAKTVIMSETLSREEIHKLWREFDKINRRLTIKDQLKSGIRHPIRAWRYAWQRIRWKLK